MLCITPIAQFSTTTLNSPFSLPQITQSIAPIKFRVRNFQPSKIKEIKIKKDAIQEINSIGK